MRIRPRAWAIAIACLLALEVALRLPIPVPVPDDYRMPDRTVVGYEQLVGRLAAQDGLRVAVVGDSVVWGTFAHPRDTLSAAMVREMRARRIPGHAANFGMSGAHANDFAPIIADIAEDSAADVIVLQFDPRFFRAGEGIAHRYPTLFDEVESPAARRALAPLVPKPGTAPRDVESLLAFADDRLSRASALWRARRYPAAALFGGRQASDRLNDELLALEGYRREFTKRPVESLPADKVRASYDIGPYTADNPHFRNLAIALDIARDNDIPVLIFSGPVDRTILDGQSLWNADEYAANLAFVDRFATEHGARFVDHTDSVPPEGLGDTHHPLAAGYTILAEKLLDDVAEMDVEVRP